MKDYNTCTRCCKGYPSRGALMRHIKVTHEDSCLCDICSCYLISREAIEDHRDRLHKDAEICGVCGFLCSGEEMIAHNRVHETEIRCGACNRLFDTKKELMEHICIINDDYLYDKYICPTCNLEMVNAVAFMKHRLNCN